jgi:hypothetical protein
MNRLHLPKVTLHPLCIRSFAVDGGAQVSRLYASLTRMKGRRGGGGSDYYPEKASTAPVSEYGFTNTKFFACMREKDFPNRHIHRPFVQRGLHKSQKSYHGR